MIEVSHKYNIIFYNSYYRTEVENRQKYGLAQAFTLKMDENAWIQDLNVTSIIVDTNGC